MPRFTLFRAGQALRSFALDHEVIRIGRLPEVEITLESATVSREHARICRDGARHVLEDAGSVNGVMIGGDRVQSHMLVPGDQIQIEDYAIVFEPPDDVFRSGAQAGNDTSPGAPRSGDPSMTYLNIARFIPKDSGKE